MTMEGYDFRAIDKIKQKLTLSLEFILTEISTAGRIQAEKLSYFGRISYDLQEVQREGRETKQEAVYVIQTR